MIIPASHTFVKGRLIVLVPDGLAGNQELAHRIYWLAVRDRCDVLYLTLVDREEDLLAASRSMATMKAMTAGDVVAVQSKIVETGSWLTALRSTYRPGDRIVCHEEQSVKNGFLRTQPVYEFLRKAFDAPVLSLSGFYQPQRMQIRRWRDSLVLWLGFFIILAAFTILEIKLDDTVHGLTGKILFILVMVIEFGAILAWNNLRSQDRK